MYYQGLNSQPFDYRPSKPPLALHHQTPSFRHFSTCYDIDQHCAIKIHMTKSPFLSTQLAINTRWTFFAARAKIEKLPIKLAFICTVYYSNSNPKTTWVKMINGFITELWCRWRKELGPKLRFWWHVKLGILRPPSRPHFKLFLHHTSSTNYLS